MELSEVLTLLGLLVTMMGIAVGILRRMESRFESQSKSLSEALGDAVRERNSQITAIRAEGNAARENQRQETIRLDRDIAGLRSEVRERLAAIPTGPQIEAMLDRRVGRLDVRLETLVVELARIGVNTQGAMAGRPHFGE